MSGRTITVLVLLYNAEKSVPALVRAVLGQRHPGGIPPEEWLEVIFTEDGSTDRTLDVLRAELERAGNPRHVRVLANERNLGLAATMNKALQAVSTSYVLTCHCDCLFGRDDYAWKMADLLDRHPDVGAITGQPELSLDPRPRFAERLNMVANLMDVFPAEGQEELVPVGFAEGRCDGFRAAALRSAGRYDESLRTAGEDQILAARLRQSGYRVCQAPDAKYVLSVSDTQDSVWKIVRKQMLWGMVHPYLLFREPRILRGSVGAEAGRNRRLRSALRASHLAGTAAYLALAGFALAGLPLLGPLIGLGALGLAKIALYARHVRKVGFSAAELVAFVLLQPPLDLLYAVGVVRGLAYLVFRPRRALG